MTKITADNVLQVMSEIDNSGGDKEIQSKAWCCVINFCQELGMKDSEDTGIQQVISFIQELKEGAKNKVIVAGFATGSRKLETWQFDKHDDVCKGVCETLVRETGQPAFVIKGKIIGKYELAKEPVNFTEHVYSNAK